MVDVNRSKTLGKEGYSNRSAFGGTGSSREKKESIKGKLSMNIGSIDSTKMDLIEEEDNTT